MPRSRVSYDDNHIDRIEKRVVGESALGYRQLFRLTGGYDAPLIVRGPLTEQIRKHQPIGLVPVAVAEYPLSDAFRMRRRAIALQC